MKHPLFTPDEELDAHLATMQWFEAQRADGHELFTHQELMRGFMWHGHRLPLVHQTQGIWKPAGFASPLTFKTAAPKSGKEAPYTDRIDDDGLLRYKFADSPGKQWTNEAMIEAARRNYPLAWLVGVKPTDSLLYYYVRFPTFIERIDRESSEFIIAIEEARSAVIENADPPLIERRYASRWTRARVHQHDFREHVISAYEISCAVCDLPHAQLLEAAHIIPDAEESAHPKSAMALHCAGSITRFTIATSSASMRTTASMWRSGRGSSRWIPIAPAFWLSTPNPSRTCRGASGCARMAIVSASTSAASWRPRTRPRRSRRTESFRQATARRADSPRTAHRTRDRRALMPYPNDIADETERDILERAAHLAAVLEDDWCRPHRAENDRDDVMLLVADLLQSHADTGIELHTWRRARSTSSSITWRRTRTGPPCCTA